MSLASCGMALVFLTLFVVVVGVFLLQDNLLTHLSFELVCRAGAAVMLPGGVDYSLLL